MDDERFDVWVKAVAATPDRRTTLRFLAGTVLGAALLRLAPAAGGAQACGAPGKPCGAGCCPDLTCGAGDRCCVPNGATKKCKKGGQCCSGICKKKKGKKTGKCACLAKGKPCTLATERKCCGGRCNQKGQCDDACPGGQRDCGDGTCAECCGDADCDDGDACTLDTCDRSTGRCAHAPVACDDGNDCTTDACDPAAGCTHANVGEATPCNTAPGGERGFCDGRGACVQCLSPRDCPEPKGRCQVATCEGNTCGVGPARPRTVCRSAAGPCDVQETCDGESLECPADRRRPTTRPATAPRAAARASASGAPASPRSAPRPPTAAQTRPAAAGPAPTTAASRPTPRTPPSAASRTGAPATRSRRRASATAPGACAQPAPEVCMRRRQPLHRQLLRFPRRLRGHPRKRTTRPAATTGSAATWYCCARGTSCCAERARISRPRGERDVRDPRLRNLLLGHLHRLVSRPEQLRGMRPSCCPAPRVAGCCSGTCTYFGVSPNCGGCGRTCSAGQICFGGASGGPVSLLQARDTRARSTATAASGLQSAAGACESRPTPGAPPTTQCCSGTCQAHPVTGRLVCFCRGGGSGCQFGAQCCFGTCANGVCAEHPGRRSNAGWTTDPLAAWPRRPLTRPLRRAIIRAVFRAAMRIEPGHVRRVSPRPPRARAGPPQPRRPAGSAGELAPSDTRSPRWSGGSASGGGPATPPSADLRLADPDRSRRGRQDPPRPGASPTDLAADVRRRRRLRRPRADRATPTWSLPTIAQALGPARGRRPARSRDASRPLPARAAAAAGPRQLRAGARRRAARRRPARAPAPACSPGHQPGAAARLRRARLPGAAAGAARTPSAAAYRRDRPGRGPRRSRLFVERARAARPDFALTDENAAAVAAICAPAGRAAAGDRAGRRPGQAPLAAGAAGAAGARGCRVLTGGAARPAGPPADDARRHRLEPRPADARRSSALFRRLAVFVGGFTLEAAEAVASTGRRRHEQLDAARSASASLVDKSLLRRTEGAAGRRAALRDAGDGPRVRAGAAGGERRGGGDAAAHAAYFLALAEELAAAPLAPAELVPALDAAGGRARQPAGRAALGARARGGRVGAAPRRRRSSRSGASAATSARAALAGDGADPARRAAGDRGRMRSSPRPCWAGLQGEHRAAEAFGAEAPGDRSRASTTRRESVARCSCSASPPNDRARPRGRRRSTRRRWPPLREAGHPRWIAQTLATLADVACTYGATPTARQHWPRKRWPCASRSGMPGSAPWPSACLATSRG